VIDRIDIKKITSVDELNLRLWSYVEGEYHNRPHSSLSGKTPLQVWESGSDDIRWPSEPAGLERAFYAETVRLVRNDSTILWRGVFYEVPPYLRGRKVRLRYSLLDPGRVSVLDANVEIPIRPVNTIANAHRPRTAPPSALPEVRPATGLNAPDLMLDRFLHPPTPEESDQQNPEGGSDE
jgi:hypothetical protein